MRKLKLYIASSINGMIARENGRVDWLDKIPNPHKLDYGYSDFYHSIDATVQGYNTFEHVRSMGVENPYPDTENFVFTRRKTLAPVPGYQFVTEDHVRFTEELKAREGNDIWLIGGGQLNALMLANGLIDEIWLFIMPVIIPDGIRLFGENHMEQPLVLQESINYSSGVTCLKYLKKNINE
ncbi:MAG: dihydrofolate reductase family protein [Cyclobacteriaceae bacterium]